MTTTNKKYTIDLTPAITCPQEPKSQIIRQLHTLPGAGQVYCVVIKGDLTHFGRSDSFARASATNNGNQRSLNPTKN